MCGGGGCGRGGVTLRYVALQGDGGCMTQRFVTPAFIFVPDNFILPCRFALIQNGVPASQHQKRCMLL